MITLYDELIRFIETYKLDIDDVDYTNVYNHISGNCVDVPVSELLELSKHVLPEFLAEDTMRFEIHFKDGTTIEWKPDNDYFYMNLIISFPPIPSKKGHVPSLIYNEEDMRKKPYYKRLFSTEEEE